MSRVKCVVCGKLFKTDSGGAKYCSKDCRKKGQRENNKEWQKNNPDYMKNYMRKYRGTD